MDQTSRQHPVFCTPRSAALTPATRRPGEGGDRPRDGGGLPAPPPPSSFPLYCPRFLPPRRKVLEGSALAVCGRAARVQIPDTPLGVLGQVVYPLGAPLAGREQSLGPQGRREPGMAGLRRLQPPFTLINAPCIVHQPPGTRCLCVKTGHQSPQSEERPVIHPFKNPINKKCFSLSKATNDSFADLQSQVPFCSEQN